MGLLNNSDWYKINRFKRYLRIPLEWGNDAVVDNAIITMYRSSAKTIIFTMQDILKLGEEARMNQPGVVCYWDWQLNALASYDLCGFYHDLALMYGRK
jgi:4-alpha-glucanotransferase